MSSTGAGGGAYGAGMAGKAFDPIEYIKKPQVILRIASWVFAIIVFGCLSSEGWYNHQCQMNNSGACSYGVAIGVLAFLICTGFLVLDALFPNISSVQHRKYAVIADLTVSGLWTFLWFVGFCYMTDAWRHTVEPSPYLAPDMRGKDNVQAAIAFSFFSIITWASLTFFAVKRYREGVQGSFASGYEPDPAQSSPYSSFPGSETGDPYQQPPFSNQGKEPTEYQPPTY